MLGKLVEKIYNQVKMSAQQSFYLKYKLSVTIGVVLSLGVIVVYLGYQLDRQLSTQSVAIQVIQLILTVFAAVIPTRLLVQRQEAEINKNRAKMALRRTVTLYNQMNQVAKHIEIQRTFIKSETTEDKMVKEALVANSFDTIDGMHKLQYGLIDDISSDWRDIIPEEFEKIQKNSKGPSSNGGEK